MAKLRVFMSHSSRDKPLVMRISRDIKSHGFQTWIDEEDIPFGASISSEIQNGLSISDVLFVFLSKHSVISRWVETEWQTHFFEEINKRQIQVFPILIDDCAVPPFLRDKRYIDFRDKGEYERSLSKTLESLGKVNLERYGEKVPSYNKNEGVLSHVQEILEDLAGEHLSFPEHRRLPIIDTLKKIMRSGKKVRLASFKPVIRARSIFDHILSLAHLCDCVLPHISHGLNPSEVGELSLCIAYHELNEVILGDIPTYTSLNNSRRNMIRVYAEERLRNVEPNIREEIANKLIWMFLSDKHRSALNETMRIAANKNSRVFPLFRALDKLDPIVAIWRYLHHYRGKLGDSPKAFNKAMKDFYENGDVRGYMRSNLLDARLIDVAILLQERSNAWSYYVDPDMFFSQYSLVGLPQNAVRSAIEGIALFHDAA